METTNDACLLMTSVDSEAAAQALAGALVEHGLAACVQIMPVTSFYVWKGEPCRGAEHLLLAKTLTARVTALEDFIRRHHPYELPELLQLPLAAGSAAYLQWLRDGSRAASLPPARAQE